MEPYLLLASSNHRIELARFRASSHNLAIEVGRHAKPNPIPINERICASCNLVEDEIHHLVKCHKYESKRNKLFEYAASIICGFNNLSPKEKIVSIMKSDDLQLLSLVAIYLKEAKSVP